MSPDIPDRLREMGFYVAFDLRDEVKHEVSIGARLMSFQEDESKLMEQVLLAKSADFALLNRRTEVRRRDFRLLLSVCLPFLWPCSRTTILENPKASASALFSGDVRLLEINDITTNAQLAEINTGSLAEKIIGTVRNRAPWYEHTRTDIESVNRRVELWQMQAVQLRDYQAERRIQ